jgi:hypothetical protein
MDYNTATAQECADWLAGDDGWKIVNSELPPCSYWWNESTQQQRVLNDPPYKLTLDAAAGALREPWRLVSIQLNSVGWAFVKAYNASVGWLEIEGPDRLTAEYRAAVASRMEGGKA